jgi:ABC-type multidrug transport system fused ATPase/permease subunit
MLTLVTRALDFMLPRERLVWLTLSAARSLLAVLDLAGVLAIGWVVTSTAMFLVEGSDPLRVISLGSVSLPTATAANLPIAALSILTLFATKAVFSVLFARQLAHLVAHVEARATLVVAETIFGSNIDGAKTNTREEVVFAVQTGSAAAFTGILNAASTIISEVVLFAIVIVGFFVVSPLTTLLTMVYFGIIAAVIHLLFGKVMTRTGEKSLEGILDANTAIGDLISVFREASVSGVKSHFMKRIYEGKSIAAANAATQTYVLGLPRHIIEIALLVGVALFVLAEIAVGDLSGGLGRLGVFLSGGFRLTAALLPLQAALMSMRGLAPHAQKVHDILSRAEQRKNWADSSQTLNGEPEVLLPLSPIGIKIEDVSYLYPNADQEAVRNVNFEVAPGTQVALIGASGSGKSTIADLICGVIEPTKGKISFFQNKLVEAGRGAVKIGYVPQEPSLISGTIAENVALGLSPRQIDRVQVLRCLEDSHLGGIVEQLPEGIDTNVGNYKDVLSGGEIQRLGLARALYYRPNILVLDEATSSLDASSEAEIYKAIDGLRENVTVLLIAHRLNSIQRSDVVHFVEHGQISTSGTFKELMENNPSIAKMVNLMRIDES